MSELLSFNEVCRELKRHRQTVEKYIGKELPEGGEFKPVTRSGYHRYFKADDVEKLKQAYLSEDSTLAEISERYKVPFFKVYRAFANRDIKNSGKRGTAFTYDEATIRMVANAEEWTIPQNVQPSRELH